MIWFFLFSGLFLGWSLGANDAANVFGTAVGSRMIRFRVAALLASVGVILGAVVSGAGTTATLGALGQVNALAGAFTVALAAGGTVAWMSRYGLPVSTTQAIVGAIIGWNFFTGSPTGAGPLAKIVSSWVLSPLLAAAGAILMYLALRWWLARSRTHLLRLDAYTRLGLLTAGLVGAYSLGANNIANVMGVFVAVSPFEDFFAGTVLILTGTQQLFLLGGIAIAVGIFTDSERVMKTVGNQLFKLTPLLALIVVVSHSVVLILFSSQELQALFRRVGLPPIPLVPVSSTQAIIGAILGIALVKGGKGIQFGILGRVVAGWVATPIIAGLSCFVALFFIQNVFRMEVQAPAPPAPAAQVAPAPVPAPPAATPAGPRDSVIIVTPPAPAAPPPR